jgi:peptidoglycan/xylan/chitin deacetylase (PgdA/CDA1 family)
VRDGISAASTLINQMAKGRRTGIVLLYHRVAPSAGDPSTELVPAVSVATFERQMRWLRRCFRVVPATLLPTVVAERRVWQRFPVAITFDDEKPEHVEWVLPVLREAGISATFFLTGLCLQDPRPTWWDVLQGAVDADLPLDHLLGDGDVHTRAERMKRMQPERRAQVVRGLEHIGARAPTRTMTPQELIAVAAQHDVGFHTLRHEFLPVLPPQALDQALQEGREALEKAVGRRINLLAYPHGGAGDREVAAARRAGYRLGFTTAGGVGWTPTMDPLRIGRTEVGEERVGTLIRQLADGLVTAT